MSTIEALRPVSKRTPRRVGKTAKIRERRSPQCGRIASIAKRTADITLTLIGLLLSLPLWAFIIAAIRVTSPGPIFFGQPREGRRGRVFTCWKFRTMVPNAEALLEDYLRKNPVAYREWTIDRKLTIDPRVTWIGRLLRATSMDELPQLWNILRGDMSLVGPRPILVGDGYLHGDSYREYKQVRPGLTGLWQVSGRKNCSYEQRADMDRQYVQNWSFLGDLTIIYRTVGVVLLRKGAH